MENPEIVARLKAVVAELDLIAEELHWREAGYPNIEDFDWSVRVRNALRNDGITSLRQLASLTVAELMRVPNFGHRSLLEVRENLAKCGLSLADTPKNRNPLSRLADRWSAWP